MTASKLTAEELLRERRYVETVPSVFRTSQERFRLRLLDEHAELTRRVQELEGQLAEEKSYHRDTTVSRDDWRALATTRILKLDNIRKALESE